uniref:AraC family transcriptional regulator n=1 Tax=Fundidesulfovibrio putealis TaxID=270496 RepID=A0A7C4ELQ5_9BACT
MNATQSAYRRRIIAVLAHIQDNLDAPLNLEGLARVAGFSPFHFHRIFLGMTGETVGAHIRRLRLSRAAYRLEFTGLRVTEVALEAGYEAPEAFSRAFKTQFGESPTLFRELSRQRRKEMLTRFFPFPEELLLDTTTPGEPMDVTIIRKGPIRVACARATGPYMLAAQKAWDALCAWAGPKGLLHPGAMFIGIGYDDPGSTPQDLLRYDACVSVGPDVAADGDVSIMEIPGGEFAVTVFKGPYTGLEAAYAQLYGQWLPASGREPDMRPGYEVYLNDPASTPPEELLTEINMPLLPR